MDAKSIRESAERRRKYVNDDDADWSLLYENAEADDDTMDLADAYLAEHPADDGDAVTVEWLYEVGFLQDRMGCPASGELHIQPQPRTVNGREFPAYACLRSVPIPTPKTRGDVRRLCKVLGITLKEAK